jgi:hypothetical protein
MSNTPDNRLPGATDPARQDDLTATLNNIMAQLTTISNRLYLQGTTLAKHALLLDGADGSAASGARPPAPNSTASGVSGPNDAGSNPDTTDGTASRNHHPPPHDYRDDMRNSFHRPKLNFPRYDGESDPLPWLNRCESYFRGTQTLAAEQV